MSTELELNPIMVEEPEVEVVQWQASETKSEKSDDLECQFENVYGLSYLRNDENIIRKTVQDGV